MDGFLYCLVKPNEEKKDRKRQRNRFSNTMKILIPFNSQGKCAGKHILKVDTKGLSLLNSLSLGYIDLSF